MDVMFTDLHTGVSLSDDLWLRIFSVVQQDTDRAAEGAMLESFAYGVDLYQQFQEMRLVCKSFNNLFMHQPSLSSCVYLVAGTSPSAASSLVPWLCRHHHSVQTLFAEWGSPMTEAALATLSFSPASLTYVAIAEPSECNISLLSPFTALRRCELTRPRQGEGKVMPFANLAAAEVVNLNPLHSLPHLTDLGLHAGHYTGIDFLPHLTSLSLRLAAVYSSGDTEHMNLSKLVRLELIWSSITAFPSSGFAVCTALRQLHSECSRVYALTSPGWMDFILNTQADGHFVALNVPAMKALIKLTLCIGSDSRSTVQLAWLHDCSGLEVLELTYKHAHLEVHVDDELLVLTRLCKLKIMVTQPSSILYVNISWKRMHALQGVWLSAPSFICDHRLLNVSKLQHQRSLRLHCCDLDSFFGTSSLFAVLALNMALKRPQVKCDLNGNHVFAQ